MLSGVILYLLTFFYLFNNGTLWEYCNWNITGITCHTKTLFHLTCVENDTLNPNIYDQGKRVCPSTQFGDFYPANELYREEFIRLHNEIRNIAASGKETTITTTALFPPAGSSLTMAWDIELEYLAMENLEKTIGMQHDLCRGTSRFAYTGQNLGVTLVQDVVKLPQKNFVNVSMQIMVDERHLIKDPIAYANCLADEHTPAGHYNQLVNGRMSLVGCASSIAFNCTNAFFYLDQGTTKMLKPPHAWACFYFACNYDNGNLDGFPVYDVVTVPASNCTKFKTVPSKKYPNLCENRGGTYEQFYFSSLLFVDNTFIDTL